MAYAHKTQHSIQQIAVKPHSLLFYSQLLGNGNNLNALQMNK